MKENYAIRHPWFYCLRKYAKIRSHFVSYPGGSFVDDIGRIRFPFEDNKRYEKIYRGTYHYQISQVLKKYVQVGSEFIDVGANIGYVSALAANSVGPGGRVHCFEPVPDYYGRLEKLKELNPSYSFILNNIALGEIAEKKPFYLHAANIGGSSLVEGFFEKAQIKNTIRVPTCRLDQYLEEKAVSNISMIKIDTEGYEWPVLKGCNEYFTKNKKRLPPVLVEVSPRGLSMTGSSPCRLAEYMESFDYRAYCIFGTHKIDIQSITDSADVLFLQPQRN